MKTAAGLIVAFSSVAAHGLRTRDGAGPTSPGKWRLSPLDGSTIALPTRAQLAFQDREMGCLIHFNMATYITPDGCNGDPALVPPRALFDPAQLDTDQWMEAVQSLGGRYATLVAKHNCGFATWPTQVRFEDLAGDTVAYNYTVAQSPVNGRDVVGEFVRSASKYGLGHGFYYSVVVNNYLNVQASRVRDVAPAPGQVGITTDVYNEIVFEQLEELWGRYGNLTEIWFDGGYSGDQRDRIQTLLQKTQPNAVIFNGCQDDGTCVSDKSIRWIGNELGHAEEENWSTGLLNSGSPDSPYFTPAECDTTLQAGGRWFFGVDAPLRSLEALIKVYHETVGRNCVLALDISPDRRGLVPAAHVARYRALGDFVRRCYDHPVRPSGGAAGGDGSYTLVFDGPVEIDRVVLMEDQTDGQVIRTYRVWGRQSTGADWGLLSKGTSVGHKKIDLFPKMVTVTEVMVNSTFVDTPKWRSVTVHKCS
ncbi:glycoside hydrolase family 29 [Cordyceps militaris]|uniref:alpha-L-fucosidase n=1 Tax=Cordyceps militaris TaxID=73501 RepID=A0A2H4SWH4_CORMI|nr:glycoside hydrolase family 29 [Cordyceps militaris]